MLTLTETQREAINEVWLIEAGKVASRVKRFDAERIAHNKAHPRNYRRAICMPGFHQDTYEEAARDASAQERRRNVPHTVMSLPSGGFASVRDVKEKEA